MKPNILYFIIIDGTFRKFIRKDWKNIGNNWKLSKMSTTDDLKKKKNRMKIQGTLDLILSSFKLIKLIQNKNNKWFVI